MMRSLTDAVSGSSTEVGLLTRPGRLSRSAPVGATHHSVAHVVLRKTA